jgi:hypothetical protein
LKIIWTYIKCNLLQILKVSSFDEPISCNILNRFYPEIEVWQRFNFLIEPSPKDITALTAAVVINEFLAKVN